MKKLVALVFLLSAAGIGVAGYKVDRWVTVSTNYANGALGAARAAANPSEYIGCQIYGNEAYNFKSVTCYARDKEGNRATCYSDNPALVEVASRLTGDGYLYFSYQAAGYCMSIRVDTYSYDTAKQ